MAMTTSNSIKVKACLRYSFMRNNRTGGARCHP
jgi:hypothetical protein